MADSIAFRPEPDRILHVEVDFAGRKGLVEVEIEWERLIEFFGYALHTKGQRRRAFDGAIKMKVIRRDNY